MPNMAALREMIEDMEFDPDIDGASTSTPNRQARRSVHNPETSVQQTARSRQTVKRQEALLLAYNKRLEHLLARYQQYKRTKSTESLRRFFEVWEAITRETMALQLELASFRSGTGKRYHLHSGFLLNLPFAYISRQFPKAFDERFSTSTSLLAICRVPDPSKEKHGLRRLGVLLEAACGASKDRGKIAQSRWLDEHTAGVLPKWIMASET